MITGMSGQRVKVPIKFRAQSCKTKMSIFDKTLFLRFMQVNFAFKLSHAFRV